MVSWGVETKMHCCCHSKRLKVAVCKVSELICVFPTVHVHTLTHPLLSLTLVACQTHLQSCWLDQVSVIHGWDVAVCLGNECKCWPQGHHSLFLTLNSLSDSPASRPKGLVCVRLRELWGAMIACHLQTHLPVSSKRLSVWYHVISSLSNVFTEALACGEW